MPERSYHCNYCLSAYASLSAKNSHVFHRHKFPRRKKVCFTWRKGSRGGYDSWSGWYRFSKSKRGKTWWLYISHFSWCGRSPLKWSVPLPEVRSDELGSFHMFGWPYVLFVFWLFFILVISRFGFEGWFWLLQFLIFAYILLSLSIFTFCVTYLPTEYTAKTRIRFSGRTCW